MATSPRSNPGERIGLTLVVPRRAVRRKGTNSLRNRAISTALALVALVLVLRFLPPRPKVSDVQANTVAATLSTPTDLHFSNLQMSRAIGGEALYVDGMVSNAGPATITGATAEVEFRDAQGGVVEAVQKPLSGMAHGGTELVRNEFARHPLAPNEMRFFRLAVEKAPDGWNHEVPSVKIVAVKTQ